MVYEFLRVIPIWMMASALMVLCLPDGVLSILGAIAKRPPNISFSGGLGDVLLIAIALMGMTIIQRGATTPLWTQGWAWQLGWLVFAIGFGLFFLFNKSTPYWRDTLPDQYHNLGVTGVFIYVLSQTAIPTLLLSWPTIFPVTSRFGWETGAYNYEKILSLLLVGAYFSLGVFDFYNGRIDQPTWWTKHYKEMIKTE